MMTSKEFVLGTMRKYGNMMAKDLQNRSSEVDGTELNAEKNFIPWFVSAKEKKNMLERPSGFVCKSSAGRVVRLIQPYDSNIYTGEPEELPAQWRFAWSKNPNHALPFVSIATSPYAVGDCCIDDGFVYRSTMDNNTWKPSEYPQGWEAVKSNI